jgi:APA family basic amino acid/polyamine antiporter
LTDLPRKLGLIDSAAIVTGTIIGAGIFLVPNLVARSLPSATWIVGAWIFTGVLSFFGALAYAELGAMIPATGGQYVFLREAWGPLFGFLCGWTYFFVVLSASIAWLGITFSTYLSFFIPMSATVAKAVGVGVIVIMTLINYRGVRTGAAVQNTFTAIKLSALLILIGSAFLIGHPAPASPAGPITMSGFGVAMISCVLTYDGWVALSFMAGEVKNPKRNLPLGIALGLAAAIAVYVLALLAYTRVLSVAEIQSADRVAAAAAERILGPAGARFIALASLMSIFGSLNGWSMTAPRIFFAQARDGLFFRQFADIHPRFETPYISIAVFGVWSALLAVTGTYESLAAYAMFAAWVFYALTSIGVIVLRRTQPNRERPYRMTGYPVTLVIFALVAIGFVVNTFITTPWPAVIGSLFIVSGVPVYFWWKSKG